MSDDLERRLEAFYRGFDDSARRVEGRWQRPVRKLPWAIAGGLAAAAAAAVLIVLSFRRPEAPAPSFEISRPAPRPRPQPVIPAPEPEPQRPEDPRPPLVTPPTPPPVKPPEPPPAKPLVPPAPVEPKPAPAPPPSEEPRKPEPKPTVVERSVATLREVEGSFELGDKPLRGRQKELAVAAGDRLKAATVVRLTLGDDRFILLSPRTVVEFRPEEKRLTLGIELGDLHAELIGPGPEIRVTTKSCEVLPLGTVFTVRAEEKRSLVIVERGRVEVKGAKGKAALRAGEAATAAEDGTVSAPSAADFRGLAWTKAHRPAESTLFFEDFTKPGAWKAELEKGVAKGVPSTGVAAVVQLETDRPIFEVPVRGQIQIVCRSDRASKMYVQFFVRDLRVNFRKELAILKGPAWRTVMVDFDEIVPMDKTKFPGRAPAGSAVYDFGLYYGEEAEKGNFWVDSIKVVEARP